MDYKELVARLRYYGTEYAIGNNLGREISGSDEVLLSAADAIEALMAELQEERYRHDRLQDFEVAEAKQLEEARAALRASDGDRL